MANKVFDKKICVVGLGYMGLPFSCLVAKAGFNVIGFDVNQKRIDDVNKGICPFNEPGLDKLIKEATATKRLKAVNKIEEADVFIISVPTPFDEKTKKADLTYVESAVKTIKSVLKKGNLVILESTVTPNTCRKLIIPILEQTKLKAGKDFLITHCPERAIPGNTLYELVNNDRIIGGFNKESAEAAKEIYSTFIKGKIYLTDDVTAEAAKLMENTFRDVNIALANEFAKISKDIKINVWEAIALANKHPRVNILSPGPGVGGHCIAIDPWFLTEDTKNSFLIPTARKINDSMPAYVVDIIKEAVKGVKKPTISILGVAYKKDVDDARESPAGHIIKLLKKDKFEVKIADPYVTRFNEKIIPFDQAIKGSDCVVIVTDHKEYREAKPEDFKQMKNKIIIDTRNCINRPLFEKNGFKVIVLGDNKI